MTPSMQSVVNAAVQKAYGGKRRIEWKEVLAGERAFNETGSWLPDETMKAFQEYLIGIKGPLTTPVGGGIRSLNVALRQTLDLYVCLRPVRWYQGVHSPVKAPEKGGRYSRSRKVLSIPEKRDGSDESPLPRDLFFWSETCFP